MATRKTEADIIIVGGGLSGLAAALFAAKAGYATIHLAPQTADDPRTSALMVPSVESLLSAGLIANPNALGTRLAKIRIIDCTQRLIRAPETLFDSATVGQETFGWNFSNRVLNENFCEIADTLDNYTRQNDTLAAYETTDDTLVVRTGAGAELTAKMIVGADGKASMVRKLAGIDIRQNVHKQSALVCDLRLGRSLDGTSVEFHYANGPFTLVPAGDDRANLVWIDNANVLDVAKSEARENLAALFAQKSQHLFGAIDVLSTPKMFPLSTFSAATAGQGRVSLVGEAAHAFPPIGAQGLNLGLRDAVGLSLALGRHRPRDENWAIQCVEAYALERAGDLQRTTAFVEGLFQSLVLEFLPAQTLRSGGMWALKLSPSLRKRAITFGMGAH